jgi:hypothetical protein
LTDDRAGPKLLSMRRYRRIRGRRLVEAILAAIRRGGGVVLRAPDPSIAPFEISVQTADGKRLELVCYAFSAGEYAKKGQGGSREHRIQVRYTSCSSHPQKLYFDPNGRRLTLYFGFHAAQSLFLAVDPAMHDPSWFSRSSRSLIEVPEEELAIATKRGWHGWERERSIEGRRRVHPLENFCTEAVLAFRPEHFLRYALFERIAAGLDTGERHLLIDQIEDALNPRLDATHA